MVSAALVGKVRAIASERADFEYVYLSGLGVRKRWYRQLWHVKYRPLPVRERSTNSGISTAQPVRCGDTLQLVLEILPITGEREFSASLPTLLPPQVLPDFDGKPLQESSRLDDRQHTTDRRRSKHPDEGDDDPGGEEAPTEDVVGEEHWDWDL